MLPMSKVDDDDSFCRNDFMAVARSVEDDVPLLADSINLSTKLSMLLVVVVNLWARRAVQDGTTRRIIMDIADRADGSQM